MNRNVYKYFLIFSFNSGVEQSLFAKWQMNAQPGVLANLFLQNRNKAKGP